MFFMNSIFGKNGALLNPDARGRADVAVVDVILVEDERLFRDLLRVSLAQSQSVRVVGDFGDGEAALAAAPALAPRVAVLDIALGGRLNGVQVGRMLRRVHPGIGIVLLSNHCDPATLAAVPDDELAGWSYLLKQSVGDVATLTRAIEGSAAGLVVIDPQLVERGRLKPGGPIGRLTPRQHEILALIAQGHANAAVAERLDIAVKTVENQINALYGEMGIDTSDASIQPRVSAVLTYLRDLRAR